MIKHYALQQNKIKLFLKMQISCQKMIHFNCSISAFFGFNLHVLFPGDARIFKLLSSKETLGIILSIFPLRIAVYSQQLCQLSNNDFKKFE